MKSFSGSRRLLFSVAVASALVTGGCGTMNYSSDRSMSQGHNVVLQGSQEVPAINTSASGSGVITIRPDRSVSGSITTRGINATAAHIHEAAAGSNGPVIVPLTKNGENGWSVPAGTTISEAQYASHSAGKLYVNVHSAANPGGEIRGQISGN